MDIIHPWLDPIEVRRLADRLMTPSAGLPDAFEGFAARDSAADIHPTPALRFSSEPNPMPASTPLAEPSAPASTAAPLGNTAVVGSLSDRIDRFRDWASHQFGASELFLLDREGTVIFDESGHGRLHFIARSLLVAAPHGKTAGNVRLKIGADATLELLPIQTSRGSFVLGMVVQETLTPTAIEAMTSAFVRAASEP